MTCNTAPLTPAEVARFNALSEQLSVEMVAAIKQCHGNVALAMALIHYESGFATAEKTVERIQRSLGLLSPIIPSAEEHHQLAVRLYQVKPLGTASAPTAGG